VARDRLIASCGRTDLVLCSFRGAALASTEHGVPWQVLGPCPSNVSPCSRISLYDRSHDVGGDHDSERKGGLRATEPSHERSDPRTWQSPRDKPTPASKASASACWSTLSPLAPPPPPPPTPSIVTAAMQTILRRAYATISNEAAAARAASTPMAVRIRRARRKNVPAALKDTLPGSDALSRSGLTPSEFEKYTRDKKRGLLPADATPAGWLARADRRRQRVRGFRRVGALVDVAQADGSTAKQRVSMLEPVGEKVYLPNFALRLLPNPTQKGEPYNPYEATFRMPQGLTKTDLRGYLSAVYGVATTYIRTDNYIAPLVRSPKTRRLSRRYARYKRAIVGLVDPFYYPDMVEDMGASVRKAHEDRLERVFGVQARRDALKMQMLDVLKRNSSPSTWSWDGPLSAKRSVIIRRIVEQRAARERQVARAKQDLLAARDTEAEGQAETRPKA
jgi:large subunit ribosomal protein L23